MAILLPPKSLPAQCNQCCHCFAAVCMQSAAAVAKGLRARATAANVAIITEAPRIDVSQVCWLRLGLLSSPTPGPPGMIPRIHTVTFLVTFLVKPLALCFLFLLFMAKLG